MEMLEADGEESHFVFLREDGNNRRLIPDTMIANMARRLGNHAQRILSLLIGPVLHVCWCCGCLGHRVVA